MINNKCYIGQTIKKNPYDRINVHFKNYKMNKNSLITKSIKKYGKENFKIELLFTVLTCQNDLNEYECFFIKENNSVYPYGFNLTVGGKQGGKASDFIIKQMSLERKGKPETKARIEAKKISIEKLKKPIIAINIVNKEKKFFNSVSEASVYFNIYVGSISAILKKREKTIKNWTFHYKNDYNYIFDLNYLLKANVKRKKIMGKKLEEINWISFESILEATKILNIDHKCIRNVCNGIQKSTKGYVFKYI